MAKYIYEGMHDLNDMTVGELIKVLNDNFDDSTTVEVCGESGFYLHYDPDNDTVNIDTDSCGADYEDEDEYDPYGEEDEEDEYGVDQYD